MTIEEDINRVRRGEANWGMIAGDFRSLQGIPDDFCSAEDPKDRVSLWNDYQARESYSPPEERFDGSLKD